MQYLRPTFTLPAAPNHITQERWDEIFGKSGSVSSQQLTDTQNAPGFDLSASSHFDTPEYTALSQADGWASDGQLAGGTRERV